MEFSGMRLNSGVVITVASTKDPNMIFAENSALAKSQVARCLEFEGHKIRNQVV